MRFDVDIGKCVVAQGRTFDLAVRFCVDSDRLALFGPSGAGKSLTLRALAGLVRPDRGRIVIGDQVWFDRGAGIDVPTRARRVGYVFQDYALFPHRTVEQNVAAAHAHWWPSRLTRDARKAVDELLDSFAIAEVRRSYPDQLSGGQRQRTALARALATRPRLLLLDEPFAALDDTLRLRLRADLVDVQRRSRIPMVLITHDPDDLIECAESVVTLAQGHVAGDAMEAASWSTAATRMAVAATSD